MLDVKALLTKILKVHGTYGALYSLSSSLSLTTTSQKVPIDTFVGEGCSKSSNGIKVKEAGVYEISGSAYFSTGFTANDLVHVEIWVNSTVINDAIFRTGTANYYCSVAVAPIIYSLNAGDVVYLYAYNQAGARGLVESRRRNGLALHRIA